MRVIVAAGVCLFDRDEIHALAVHLAAALREQGHNVEVMCLDAEPNLAGDSGDQAAAVRSLRVDHADHLICLGWPSYLLSHPRKIVWLTHRSICGGWHDECPPPGRMLLARQEHHALHAAHRCFALSATILRTAAELSLPAINLLGLPILPDSSPHFESGVRNSDFVAVRWSRNPRARLELGFCALGRTTQSLRLVVTRENMSADEQDSCRTLARTAGVQDRIEVLASDPAEERLMLSKARGVLDLSRPGLECGLWLDRAARASTPIVAARGHDASDLVPGSDEGLPSNPSVGEVTAALDGLFRAQGARQNDVSITPKPTIRRPDWKQAVASLLS